MFDFFGNELFSPLFTTVYGPTKQIWESKRNDSLDILEDFANSLVNKHVVENKDGTKLFSFDMPGIKESDLEMEYESDSGSLFIKAERKLNHKHYAYSNKIFVGKGLQSDAISAKFEDGVLSVTVNSKKSLEPKAVQKIQLTK